ncbi:MAG: nitroreductase [Firmicutes bacterium]|nr:nitroreductase [Bacillota bacterium]
MTNYSECIKARRSVRTYEKRIVDEALREQLLAFGQTIKNPYNLPVEFRFMEAGEHGLSCPVVSGTDLYVAGKIKAGGDACVAFGYTFETFVLYAWSLGLGTVWLGGTMNRPAYEAAMELGDDEMMPCASPLGYPAKKMSVKETVMRKAIKADERLPFGELFFDGDFTVPLTAENAGNLAFPLEMVRLAPSALNKQPWRVVKAGLWYIFT